MKKSFVTTGLILLLIGNSYAAGYQDLSPIRQLVKEFLLSFPELKQTSDTLIKVNSIDRRLKLSRCEKLDFDLATGSRLLGKLSVKVMCKKPKAWSFYVTAHISRFGQVYIANNALSRGHLVRAGDVYQSRKDLSRLPFGYIIDDKAVIGKQLKRHVQAGTVLTPSQLTSPIVIKRGEIISLQKKAAGFAISMKGTALSDGAVGERIRVKNNSSKRIIEGTITQSGIVMIGN